MGRITNLLIVLIVGLQVAGIGVLGFSLATIFW